jgi:hypothetical protein
LLDADEDKLARINVKWLRKLDVTNDVGTRVTRELWLIDLHEALPEHSEGRRRRGGGRREDTNAVTKRRTQLATRIPPLEMILQSENVVSDVPSGKPLRRPMSVLTSVGGREGVPVFASLEGCLQDNVTISSRNDLITAGDQREGGD